MQENDRILVTGGLSGIGAGVVAEYGSRCVVWSRRSGVDTANPESVQAATKKFLADHGAPFALVHCVGDFDERTVLESDMEHYEHMVRSNLTTAYVMSKSFAPAMRDAGRGRVVFFASAGVESQVAFSRAPIYYAINAALVVMARALAKEVAASGVTVNVVSPGIIRHASSHKESQDRMAAKIPLGRVGGVRDVMGAVRLLLSDDGGYITGSNLTVDGGVSL